MEFKKTYQTLLPATELNAALVRFVTKGYIESNKLSHEYFVIRTKPNSLRGFGLNLVGLIDRSDDQIWIQLRVTFRHDFKFFNLVFCLGLLISFVFDRAKVNTEMLFEQRMAYVLVGLLLLALIDFLWLLIPWLRIEKGLKRDLLLRQD